MVETWRQNEYVPRQSNSQFAYCVFRLADINVRIGSCLLKAIGKYSESHEVCIWFHEKNVAPRFPRCPTEAVNKRGIVNALTER
jgi:Zn-finger protein